MAFGRKGSGRMLGAFQPSGSTKPGSMPLPKPGTGGQNLVDKFRGGLRGARAVGGRRMKKGA